MACTSTYKFCFLWDNMQRRLALYSTPDKNKKSTHIHAQAKRSWWLVDTTFSCPYCWSLILLSEAPEKNTPTVVNKDTHTHIHKQMPQWPNTFIADIHLYFICSEQKFSGMFPVFRAHLQSCFHIIEVRYVRSILYQCLAPASVLAAPSNGDRISLCLPGSGVYEC